MNQAKQIEEIITELKTCEKAYTDACLELAEAEAIYKHKKSLKYLQADGTIADRNAQADIECWDEHKRKLTAEAVLALTKAAMENCRNILSARQSILSAQSKTNLAMDFHAVKQI